MWLWLNVAVMRHHLNVVVMSAYKANSYNGGNIKRNVAGRQRRGGGSQGM